MRVVVWLYGAIVMLLGVLLGLFALFGYCTQPDGVWVWGGLGVVAIALISFGSNAIAWSKRTGETTLRGFNRVKIGATIDECISALGPHGRHVTTSTEKVAGRVVERKQGVWGNENGSFCEVIFENDRVVSKSQFGLN